MGFAGIAGFLVFVAAIYAIIQIVKSNAEGSKKILWVLLVAFLPPIGIIAWYIAGPGKKPF